MEEEEELSNGEIKPPNDGLCREMLQEFYEWKIFFEAECVMGKGWQSKEDGWN